MRGDPAQGRSAKDETEDVGAASVQAAGGLVTRWWQRLVLWQTLTAGATVAALALGVALTQPNPAQPPIVVVMQAAPDLPDNARSAARHLAEVHGAGRN